MTIALVGDPNSGKTTLFNTLTGLRQKVGNWPGVTVEKKQGSIKSSTQEIELIDLPGIYSLNVPSNASQDEIITRDYLEQGQFSFIINVIDVTHLERSLYLTSQLIDRKLPFIAVLSKLDVAKKQGITLDLDVLSQSLGVKVFSIESKDTLKALNDQIFKHVTSPSPLTLPYPNIIKQTVNQLSQRFQAQGYKNARELALKKIEEGHEDKQEKEELSTELACVRFQFAHQVTKKVLKQQTLKASAATRWLDKLFLNRLLGLPLFLGVMYLMFFISINVGGVFQDAFSGVTQTVFVSLPAHLGQNLAVPEWLIAIVSQGVGLGLSTTLTFIPVMFALFLCLSFLEGSGYIVRAAFVMDKLMRLVGLPGKAFVPMIVGFGCNVPAIMGTRTLESERDRILTTLMVPFMSCSARLAIFSVFVAAFFPENGTFIVFSLYLIGVTLAILTGWVVKKAFAIGGDSPLLLELPNYQWPKFKHLIRDACLRVKHFFRRAVVVIVPVCVLLGGLNALTLSGEFNPGSPDSLLAIIGQGLTPLFSPMGVSEANWPATVGLLSGVLAKEVVIGTLNSLYTPELSVAASHSFHLLTELKASLYTIVQNAKNLGGAFSSPLVTTGLEDSLSQAAFGQMALRFDSGYSAYAYLLFTLLYVPCVSTLAVIKKELNRFWMYFSLIWSTSMAYLIAVSFYQVSQLALSGWSILGLIISFIVMFGGVLISLRYFLTLSMEPGRGWLR